METTPYVSTFDRCGIKFETYTIVREGTYRITSFIKTLTFCRSLTFVFVFSVSFITQTRDIFLNGLSYTIVSTAIILNNVYSN